MNIKILKNLFYSAPLFLSSMGSVEAVIFGDKHSLEEAISYQPRGSYPIEVIPKEISNPRKTSGTATVVKTKEGIYGLTCAHAFQKQLPDDRIGLLLKTEKHETSGGNTIDSIYSFIKNFLPHPQAEKTEANWIESSKNDIGLFTVSQKELPGLHTLEGEIYKEPLLSGTTYEVRLKSYGPVFDNQLSFYKKPSECYHETPLKITYEEEKGLYQKHVSRSFYLKLRRTSDQWDWFCDLLPEKGDINTINGDSGGIAVTLDGQLFALQRGEDWSEFYKDNKQLAGFMREIKSQPNYFTSENGIKLLIERIHQEIAVETHTHKIQLQENMFLYRFTLKEHHPSIVAYQYFTPLSIHKDFIEQYIKEHKWSCNPSLKIHPLYLDLKTSLRPLKENELASLKKKIASKKILCNVHIQELKEKTNILSTKKNGKIPLTEEDKKLLNGLQEQSSKMEQELSEMQDLQNLYDGLQYLQEDNESLLAWFSTHKNILKEGNGHLINEGQQHLKELESLAIRARKILEAYKAPQ